MEFSGQCMQISRFEIVDLGTGHEGCVSVGTTFHPHLDSEILGEGDSAHLAFEDATKQLALEGLDVRMLHEAGIEAGFSSEAARTLASEIHEEDEPEEDESSEDVAEREELSKIPIVYHVLIRFKDPTPDNE